MKEKFKHYHLIENLENLYKNAIIVLDTNSILNIYRYNTDNRNKYLEILKKVSKRIYLTHQICNEFYKNRFLIIENRTTFKENIFEMISENQTKLLNILENCSGTEKYNSSLSILKHEIDLKEKISNNIKVSLEDIKKKIDEFKQDLDITYIQKKDPILEEINLIVGTKVHDEFSNEIIEEIYKKGDERFNKEVPPGYKDKDKPGNEKYNDFLIWNELIDLANKLGKDILFISDDRKEDWAIKYKGKDYGPRTELLKEFLKETNHLFYSITTKRFIEIISQIHRISDTELLIKETENITKNIYEKEKLVFEEIKRLNREKYEHELLHLKLKKLFEDKKSSSQEGKENNSDNNNYYKIFFDSKKKKDLELERRIEESDDELKNKFIWKIINDYNSRNNDNDDDDDDEKVYMTFEK